METVKLDLAVAYPYQMCCNQRLCGAEDLRHPASDNPVVTSTLMDRWVSYCCRRRPHAPGNGPANDYLNHSSPYRPDAASGIAQLADVQAFHVAAFIGVG